MHTPSAINEPPGAEPILESIEKNVESGRYLEALKASAILGPLASWKGCAARTLAGRMAANLGAPRLSAWLHLSAWRENRRSPVAAYFRAAIMWRATGPFRTMRFLDRLPEFPDATSRESADLLSLKARVLSTFRDFDRADVLMAEAEALAPDHPWLWCERAELRRFRDDHEGALESVRHALELRPYYRPAVQVAAEVLQLLKRDEEALALLCEAGQRLESGAVTSQLAMLQGELGDFEAAVGSWERTLELHPLAEKDFLGWLHGQLADASYRAGRFAVAAEFARKVDRPFYKEFAARLDEKPANARKVLPVEFVAQYYLTCAPATLSGLSNYWRIPVDHARLAAEICYEGTFDHIERNWAVQKGFHVREFRLDWESACELIDRGIPFALTTTETTSAHLQAVIGYDKTRASLVMRDPSRRNHTEALAQDFLERYAAFGPRAMLMVPREEIHRLDGLLLPEEEQYDRFYMLQRALEQHDRPGAAAELEFLKQRYPGERMTLWAQRRLANYDANPTRELEAVEGLVSLFPNCALLLWNKVHLLDRLGLTHDHRRVLHELAGGTVRDPVFWMEWGRTLGQDVRHIRFARRYLLLALRVQPCEGAFLCELAHSLWSERQFEAATSLYRLAACLPGGIDKYGLSYFYAARHIRKTEEALALLRHKHRAAEGLSAVPSRVLFQALSAIDRSQEALDHLEEALRLRPKDGELMLLAADAFARHGQRERAGELLDAARPISAHPTWLRTSANLADYRCDHAVARQSWSALLEAEPLAIDAIRSISRLTAEADGHPAAHAFLGKCRERFPHYLPLARLHLEWLRSEPPEIVESIIRQFLELNPGDAWLRRELALNLAGQKKFAEAEKEAGEALKSEPYNVDSPATLARIFEISGRNGPAAEACREALALSIDFVPAMDGLFRVSTTFEQKREAVDFIRQQLAHQVVFGDCLLHFHSDAYTILEPAEMLSVLREALAARNDLWQAWIAVASQLADMGQLDEALSTAEQAAERFPLIPRVWYELSLIRKARGEREEEIAPLRRALSLSPGWSMAARALGETYTRMSDLKNARVVYETAVWSSPLDAYNHGCHADILWLLGCKEEAIASVQRALRIEPEYSWGWNALQSWSLASNGPNLAEELARELTRERPGRALSWLRLADSLPEKACDEKLNAIEKALDCEPRNLNAHDTKAIILALAGRMADALAACSPDVFAGERPALLQGREAWIHFHQGNIILAVEKMQAAVKLAPDYQWGWSQLAEWLAQLDRHPEALEAAKSLARLVPRSPTPLGYIADLQMRMGEEREARATLRKAFLLDPGYEYAGFNLFDAQLKVGHRDGAKETLSLLEIHHPGPRARAARARMFCNDGETEKALEILRELCHVPAQFTFALRVASEAISSAGAGRKAEKIYASLLDDPTANSLVGTLWVAAFTNRKYWWIPLWRLRSLDPRSPIGFEARLALLEVSSETKKSALVRRILRRDGPALRESTVGWAKGGYALATLASFKETAKWLHDWRERKDAAPWMLFNLALSLRHLENDAEAREVSMRAVSLAGDHTTHMHQSFLAWDEALSGDVESARQRLAQIPEMNSQFATAIKSMAAAIIAVLSSSQGNRKDEFQLQRVQLTQAPWSAELNDKLLRRMGRQTVRTMAAEAGSKPFRLGRGFLSRLETVGGGTYLGAFLIMVVLMQLLRACSTAIN